MSPMLDSHRDPGTVLVLKDDRPLYLGLSGMGVIMFAPRG